MPKVIAFAGSNSSTSINKQLASYAASLLEQADVEILDLNDYPLPVFGVDLEQAEGYPDHAVSLNDKITQADGIILSLAENNGSYSAVFKNLFDWLSRINGKTWQGKPMLLMATSPGGRGGASVLAAASDRFPRHDAQITDTFSLPSFADNFKDGIITNQALDVQLKAAVKNFESQL